MANIMKISSILRKWYEKNKRDLPWRHTSDPYKIWLSEVILQQTRVNQGLEYYLDFIKVFPDVNSLALAGEDEVLKKWQGLGYYSRARNLHSAAKDVVEQMGGELPRSYDGLLKLKGVGKYTASAIASICFGEPRAVVDGNVYRVIARLFGVEEPVNSATGGRIITSMAEELLDRNDPGTHNQAMMEFGALQCVPTSPGCPTCPLLDQCEAHKTGRVDRLPVKIPKRKPVERWMYFYIIRCEGEIILTKRGTGDIWKSLYHFPVLESDTPLTDEEMLEPMVDHLVPVPHNEVKEKPVQPDRLPIEKISDPIRHQLTHRTLHARFIHVKTGSWPDPLPPGWMIISADRLDDFPVPRLIHKYMETADIQCL